MWLPPLVSAHRKQEGEHLFDRNSPLPLGKQPRDGRAGLTAVSWGAARWGHNAKALSNCWVFHDNDCHKHLGETNCHPPGQYAHVYQCRGANCSPVWAMCPCVYTERFQLPAHLDSVPVCNCGEVPDATHLHRVPVCTCERCQPPASLGASCRPPGWCVCVHI